LDLLSFEFDTIYPTPIVIDNYKPALYPKQACKNPTYNASGEEAVHLIMGWFRKKPFVFIGNERKLHILYSIHSAYAMLRELNPVQLTA
jgi:hypothetical protein